jgi:hypothetical protein
MSGFEADRVFSSAPSPDITELRRHLKQRLKTSPILRPHLSNLEQMLKSWDAAGTVCTWPAISSGPFERSRPYGNPPHSAAYGDDDATDHRPHHKPRQRQA